MSSAVNPQHISVSALTLKLAAAGTTNGTNEFSQHFHCLYCCECACHYSYAFTSLYTEFPPPQPDMLAPAEQGRYATR